MPQLHRTSGYQEVKHRASSIRVFTLNLILAPLFRPVYSHQTVSKVPLGEGQLRAQVHQGIPLDGLKPNKSITVVACRPECYYRQHWQHYQVAARLTHKTGQSLISDIIVRSRRSHSRQSEANLRRWLWKLGIHHADSTILIQSSTDWRLDILYIVIIVIVAFRCAILLALPVFLGY